MYRLVPGTSSSSMLTFSSGEEMLFSTQAELAAVRTAYTLYSLFFAAFSAVTRTSALFVSRVRSKVPSFISLWVVIMLVVRLANRLASAMVCSPKVVKDKPEMALLGPASLPFCRLAPGLTV